MTDNEIALQRLCSQLICHQPFRKVEETVQWLTAIQAQDYSAALWAVGLRTSGNTTENDVEKAISTGEVVRTWAMRGTLHFMAAEDVGWMLKLLTPRVIRSSAGRYRQLELDSSIFNRCRQIVEHILQEGKQLTRVQLYTALEDAGVSPDGQRGYHILSNLAQKGVICWGPRRDKEHTFVLLDEWIDRHKKLEGDEALAELASRYIAGHGPATEYDFAGWSGLTITTARKAFHMVEENFEKEDIHEHTYWFSAPKNELIPAAKNVWLLPAFDEILCGYKDRSAILETEHASSVILRNGIFKPTIISNGKAIGSWKPTLNQDQVIVNFQTFDKLSEEEKSAIIEQGMKFGNFLERQTEIKT